MISTIVLDTGKTGSKQQCAKALAAYARVGCHPAELGADAMLDIGGSLPEPRGDRYRTGALTDQYAEVQGGVEVVAGPHQIGAWCAVSEHPASEAVGLPARELDDSGAPAACRVVSRVARHVVTH